ncbi:hypothetical protein ABKA04_003855 [Annulohypoxylon sp. FPYF3050]
MANPSAAGDKQLEDRETILQLQQSNKELAEELEKTRRMLEKAQHENEKTKRKAAKRGYGQNRYLQNLTNQINSKKAELADLDKQIKDKRENMRKEEDALLAQSEDMVATWTANHKKMVDDLINDILDIAKQIFTE